MNGGSPATLGTLSSERRRSIRDEEHRLKVASRDASRSSFSLNFTNPRGPAAVAAAGSSGSLLSIQRAGSYASLAPSSRGGGGGVDIGPEDDTRTPRLNVGGLTSEETGGVDGGSLRADNEGWGTQWGLRGSPDLPNPFHRSLRQASAPGSPGRFSGGLGEGEGQARWDQDEDRGSGSMEPVPKVVGGGENYEKSKAWVAKRLALRNQELQGATALESRWNQEEQARHRRFSARVRGRASCKPAHMCVARCVFHVWCHTTTLCVSVVLTLCGCNVARVPLHAPATSGCRAAAQGRAAHPAAGSRV